MSKPEKLIEALRNNIIEREHFGDICVVEKNNKTKCGLGNYKNKEILLRSAQKPFQALLLIESGAFDAFNLDSRHLAICSGSHSGTKEHILLVRDILKKIGLCEADLKCGAHPPLDKEAKINLFNSNTAPKAVHNNCSAKHAGMLAICQHKGWNIKNYLEIDHPLQKKIIQITKELSGYKKKPPTALDGCDAPVIGLPLKNIATGFLSLLNSFSGKVLIHSCLQHPLIFGGKKRFDSEIIQLSKGKLFAKVGAEGLIVVINTKQEKCLVIKINDANMNARAIVTIDALQQLNWIDKNEYLAFDDLYPKKIFTHNQKVVGEIKTVFNLGN